MPDTWNEARDERGNLMAAGRRIDVSGKESAFGKLKPFTAADATALSEESNKPNLAAAFEEIRKAAQRGEFQVNLYFKCWSNSNQRVQLMKALQELSYRVTWHSAADQGDGPRIEVSWGSN